MKGHIAGFTTLLITLLVSVIVFKIPAGMAIMSATQGEVYGILPIGWIIISSVFLYKLTVKIGQLDVIRSSVLSIKEDRRLQALLVAFSFGAFLEGAAGFSAPVAISASIYFSIHSVYLKNLTLLNRLIKKYSLDVQESFYKQFFSYLGGRVWWGIHLSQHLKRF